MSRKFYYSSRAVLLSAIVLCISGRAKLAAATCSSSVPTEIGMDDVSCSGLSAGTTCDHFCEDGFYSNVEATQTDVCEFFLDENVVFNISRSPAQEVSWTVASKTQGCVQSGALATLLGTYKVNVNVYVGADDDESFGLYLKEYDNLPCIAPRADGEYYQCQVSFLKKFDGSETLDDFDLKLFDENVINGVAIKDISTLTFTKVVDQANVCAFVIEDHVNETDVLCNATDSEFVEDGRFVHDNTTGISSCVDSAESLNILAGLYEITLQVYGHQDDDYTATYYIDPHGDKIFCNRDHSFQCHVSQLTSLNGTEPLSAFDLKLYDALSDECYPVHRNKTKMFMQRVEDACSFHLPQDLDISGSGFDFVFTNETANVWVEDTLRTGVASCVSSDGQQLSVEPGVYSLNYRITVDTSNDKDMLFSMRPKGTMLQCAMHEGDQSTYHQHCELHTIITLRGDEDMDDFKLAPTGYWYNNMDTDASAFDINADLTSFWLNKLTESSQGYSCNGAGVFSGTALTCTQDDDHKCGNLEYPSGFPSDGFCEVEGFASVVAGNNCSTSSACAAADCCTGTSGVGTSSSDDYDIEDALPWAVPLAVVTLVGVAVAVLTIGTSTASVLAKGPKEVKKKRSASISMTTCTATLVGSHANSEDEGRVWVSTGVAFDLTVDYEGGLRRTFIQRERPFIVLNATTGLPAYLVSAVAYSLEPALPACTIFQPVGKRLAVSDWVEHGGMGLVSGVVVTSP
eukprot:g2926.t1